MVSHGGRVGDVLPVAGTDPRIGVEHPEPDPDLVGIIGRATEQV